MLRGRIVMIGLAALVLQGARAQDESLPQPGAIASPGSVLTAPSSTPLPINPALQNGGDVPLTPINPVPANPLPPLPKLELDTSKVYKPVLPELPSTESSPLFGPKILVKHFVFTGNTVYDSATLDKV